MPEVPKHAMVLRHRNAQLGPAEDCTIPYHDSSQAKQDYVAFAADVLSEWRPETQRRRSLGDLAALCDLLARIWYPPTAQGVPVEKRRDSAPAMSGPAEVITITNRGRLPETKTIFRVSRGSGVWREVLPASTALAPTIVESVGRSRERLGIAVPLAGPNVFLRTQARIQSSVRWARDIWPRALRRILAANTNAASIRNLATRNPFIRHNPFITRNPSRIDAAHAHTAIDRAPISSISESLADVWICIVRLCSWIWLAVRTPTKLAFAVVLLTAALVLLGLLCLQCLALWYTVTSRAFLNTFCTQSLPIIRDWVCSEWDIIEKETFVPPPFWDVQDLQDTISDDVTISLATELIQLGTKMREIKVRLPTFELNPKDLSFVRHRLVLYDDLSDKTVDHTQLTIQYITGTLDRIASSTANINASLNRDSLLSTSAISSSPGFFPSLIIEFSTVIIGQTAIPLLWLPFVPTALLSPSPSELAIPLQLFRREIYLICERLANSETYISGLKDLLTEMANIADEVASRTSSIEAGTMRDKIIRAEQRWVWKTWLSQPSLQDYQTARRLAGLARMGTVFMGAMKYLQETGARVGAARHACALLQQRLLEEEVRLSPRVGAKVEVLEWISEQTRILADGGKVLGREVTDWRNRKVRYIQEARQRG